MFTQEPDAFESYSEIQMQMELEKQIEQDHINQEKQQNKYKIKTDYILLNLAKNINMAWQWHGKLCNIIFTSPYFQRKFKNHFKYSELKDCLAEEGGPCYLKTDNIYSCKLLVK